MNTNPNHPTPIDTPNNAEKTTDIVNDLPQGVRLIYFEILRNRENKNKSIEHIKNYQNIIKEKQQLLQDYKTKKDGILTEIITHQSQLDDTKYQKDLLRKKISKACQMHKEINDFCIKNEHILQQCCQDKITTSERIEESQTKMCDNFAKLEEVLKKKQDKVTSLNGSVLNQRQAYEQYLTMCKNQLLENSEKLNISTKELEDSKSQFEEISCSNCSCLNKIEEYEKDNEQLKNILKNKQENSDDLLKQTEELFQSFEQNKKEMYNMLDDKKYEIQKKEIEMKSTERGMKNQTEYNKTFREKIAVKEKQVTDQRLQNEQLETIQKEKQTKSAVAVKDFEEEIALCLKEQESTKALWFEECKLLNEAEQSVTAAKQINGELMLSIKAQEHGVEEFKNKHEDQGQHTSTCEQKLTSLLSQLDNIKKKLNERQMQILNHEQEKTETIKTKTSEAQTLIIATGQTKNDQLVRREAIIQEMNAIKADFDAKTTEQTKNFEEKQKQLQSEIQTVDREMTDMRNSRVQSEEELNQLNKNCDTIMQEIKDQENLNESLSKTFQNSFETPPIFLPPSTVTRASHRNTSALVLPPTRPIRHRDFDELSGSSAEGNVITYQQLLQYKREKQQRHQLRKRRQQSEYVSHPQNDNVDE